MDIFKSIKSKVIHSAFKPILHANRWLENYNEVIWLIGDGRSGTTWISNLINHNKTYREIFEPFHPLHIKKMNFLELHQYVRAGEDHKQLEKVADEVFTGKITDQRIDYNNRSLSYKGLLIKDIFANLFSYWASLKFPNLKIVLLIRNPFAVALSKYKKKSWGWLTNPMILLKQKKLFEDHLYQFEKLIIKTSNKNDFILNQVLIWSIINYIPLRQFRLDEIRIIFYEEVYTNPHREISNLLSSKLKNYKLRIDEKIVNSPSRVAGQESTIKQGNSPIKSWKNELTAQQIDAGLIILKEFGFDKLYSRSSMPNRDVLTEIHR